MLVKGLDDKEYKLNLTKYHNKQRKNSSALHKRAREIIKEAFPSITILEEVRLPGTKEVGRASSKELYADFFIPSLRIIVEVHGEQHYHFNNHYHRNQLEFLVGQKRDRQKQYWCEINNITYIELPYNESEREWTDRIKSG